MSLTSEDAKKLREQAVAYAKAKAQQTQQSQTEDEQREQFCGTNDGDRKAA